MKEMKIRFSGSSSPDFDNAIFRYQYDGNGRLAVMLSSVGTGNDHQHTGKFHSKAIFLHNECSLSTSTFLTFSHTFFEEIYNRGFLSCLKGGGEHSAYFQPQPGQKLGFAGKVRDHIEIDIYTYLNKNLCKVWGKKNGTLSPLPSSSNIHSSAKTDKKRS